MRPSDIRIVFMGTPDFAVPSLEILYNQGFSIVSVVTATDKLGGRGKNQWIASPVKKFAAAHGIPVLQPKNLKAKTFIEDLKRLQADLQIVVAFRMLPEVVWDMPALGTYNLHGSLLPAYRGAAPIHWAVIRGEQETGLTTFKLQHAIDTGSILMQRKVAIDPQDTTGSLYERMKTIGAEVVLDTVKTICLGNFQLQPQNEQNASHAPKIYTEDAEIDFNQTAMQVYNFVRGMSPVPGAWTMIDGKVLKCYFVERADSGAKLYPGEIDTDQRTYLRIGTNHGAVQLTDVQLEGKRRMDIRTFLNGYTIKVLKTSKANGPS